MSSPLSEKGSFRRPSHPLPRLAVALALAILPVGPSAGADDVFLENGRVFEEVIATLTETHVIIEMDYGRMRLPRAQVVRVEERATPLEGFRERRSALVADPASPVSSWVELARWAWAHGLERDATETALLAARLDPEAEGLDVILTQRGYELDVDLGWVTRAVAMERRGLVLFRGDWVTPERRVELREGERVAREEASRQSAEREARRREEREKLEAERGPTANEVALASIELARELTTGRVGIALGRTSSLSALHPVFVPYLPLSGGGGFWAGRAAGEAEAEAEAEGGVVAGGAPTVGAGRSGSAEWDALATRIPGSRLPLSSFRKPP